MWNDVPGRDDAWRQETLSAMDFDQEKFAQEYECEFLGSSGTLIAGWKLKELVYKDPIRENYGVSVYEDPIQGHNYVCTVDVSRGKGLDYSAFQMIDVTEMPYKQVCVFRDNMITPVDYAQIINRMGNYYNEASILVEVNDIGEQVSTILMEDFEYENLLLTENSGRGGKRLIQGVAGFSGRADIGVRTTKSVKTLGCSMTKLLVEQNQLIINDFNTISEFATFSKKANSYEAEQGCHDDTVMCIVLFGWLSDQKFFKELTDINTINNLKDLNEEQIMNELTPFGIIDTGHNPFDDPDIMIASKGDEFLTFGDENW